MKSYVWTAVFLLAIFPLVGQAQSVDLNSTNTSNANADTHSNAMSQNEGVQNTIVQNGAPGIDYSGHFSQTVKSQVPISVVGYGSFSQSSCITAIGGGATTRLFSFVYNGPKADINCQHVVQGDAFGRATQLAKQVGVEEMARASLSMVFYAYCTSSEEYTKACIQQGLVVDSGTTQKIDGRKVAVVYPAKILPENAEKLLSRRTANADEPKAIPSRPDGWTNAPVAANASAPAAQWTTSNWVPKG